MSINVENLSFMYNKGSAMETKVLSDITLDICDGDFFGIIGHTGSGKSTLIQQFNALLIPSEGRVVTEGIEIKEKSKELKILRAKCGMVFQYPEYQLFGETVADDVAFGLINFKGRRSEKNPDGLTGEEIKEKVRRAMDRVGLPFSEYAMRSPFSLSGGQKRRAAIAGIIVTEPDVLILDEPQAGLDPSGKVDILNLLKELHKTTCKTIIMISHDMDEIAETCNRVGIIDNGRLVSLGKTEEVFSDGNKLKEYGLDLPLCAKVKIALKEEKGIDVPFTSDYDKLAKYVANALKGESV